MLSLNNQTRIPLLVPYVISARKLLFWCRASKIHGYLETADYVAFFVVGLFFVSGVVKIAGIVAYAATEMPSILYTAHPYRIPAGKIIVYGNHVNSFSGKSIQIYGQSSRQGLAFACFHLGNFSLVKGNAPNICTSKCLWLKVRLAASLPGQKLPAIFRPSSNFLSF